MSLIFRPVPPDSADAVALLCELNEALMEILGHNGTLHVCLDDFAEERAFFLVGYDNGTPVCCAGLRRLDEQTAEIKRVFARRNTSGNAAALMASVEDHAAALGYRRAVLECREGNPHAIAFYKRVGYTVCPNYPPYDAEQESDAVCLEKRLPISLHRAGWADFDRLAGFYRRVIDTSPEMSVTCRWVWGLHPSAGELQAYIDDSAMYYVQGEDGMLSAAALTVGQPEEYRKADWGLSAAEDEVAVLHLFCVDPEKRRMGLARRTLTLLECLARLNGRKTIRLDTFTVNAPARALYESAGYIPCGIMTEDTPNAGVMVFMLYGKSL